MKKKIKYLVLSSIAVLCIVLLRSNASKTSKNRDILANSSQINKEIKSDSVTSPFAPNITAKVGHKLDSLLKRVNKRHDFHGSLLVAKNGSILYKNQVGYADFRKKEMLNDSSMFQLASVSKQFTAAAIMLLYERGQIKLTDTVTNYYPDFPYEGVTIKNLLNHTAGLPQYFWVAEHKWTQQKAPTNSEMMDLMATSKVQRFFKPGSKFNYSNTGYFVLASIVEKVSKKSFSSFMKENIFDPLEMNDSFVYSFENDVVKENQLNGYRLYRGWRHLKINYSVNDAVVGDKNVYSTSEDLYKWIVGLNNGKLLSQESLDMMYAKGETKFGREIPYGFGFRIDTKDEDKIYHHGRWNGFRTGLTQYTKDNLVVIVLEHTSYNSITSLNNTVKQIVTDNLGT